MNQSGKGTETQLQNLLDVVSRNREERCTAILDRARQQAGQIIGNAYRRARSDLHRQVLDTRQRAQRRLASAQAQSQTRLRLQKQYADDQLLARAWEPLTALLNARWQDQAARSRWIEKLVDQAATTLIGTPWRIEHPDDWSGPEQSALKERLHRRLGSDPVFIAEPGISAGLRICAGQACVDGTVAGLLKSRTRVESLLLAKLNQCRGKLNGDKHD